MDWSKLCRHIAAWANEQKYRTRTWLQCRKVSPPITVPECEWQYVRGHPSTWNWCSFEELSALGLYLLCSTSILQRGMMEALITLISFKSVGSGSISCWQAESSHPFWPLTAWLHIHYGYNTQVRYWPSTQYPVPLPILRPIRPSWNPTALLCCNVRHCFNVKQEIDMKADRAPSGSQSNVKTQCGSRIQRTPQRETASYKVTADLLLAEYPWQCSFLILYTSALGARDGGRKRWDDGVCVCVCVHKTSLIEAENFLFPAH